MRLITPVIEWRKHNLLTIERNELSLLQRILPPNVKQMYIHQEKTKIHVKLILYG